jgi:hypothetical protein
VGENRDLYETVPKEFVEQRSLAGPMHNLKVPIITDLKDIGDWLCTRQAVACRSLHNYCLVWAKFRESFE